ncbi:PREDICTED: UPF0481 protein At3g47200-like [Ipomoea nil]|uniref:UPF0481 protein At3g47200-like n=1 Tax=Ipomoea nil TaxID=35883 RepID=UPI0009016954|nr:PREDICTED: UPF0481 protein At3g47200-like [Ipomoea nil]
MALSSRNGILGGEESGLMLVPQESMNKIQRVRSFLRGSKRNDDYNPKVISLGPYHHFKPEVQALEGLKPKVFDNFISRGYSQSDANFYGKTVLEVVGEARRCYVEGSTGEFDDSQFAKMMLLDSCFLLCYMLDGFDGFWFSEMIGASFYLFIQRDLFLFENQIPLWIVEFLFNDRFATIMGISWKELLVGHCQRNLYGEEYTVDNDMYRDGKPLHLLQAFQTLMACKSNTTPTVTPLSTHSSWWGRCCPNFMRTQENSTIIKSQKDSFEKYGYVFRSVMDLKAKGIHFGHSDNIYSVTSINFESNYAYAKLKLPIWYASFLSKVFFTNMLAYEICSNGTNGNELEITSYINFMKSLIVCPNDVKELREKRIISNTLGDDMKVVQLFKALNPHGIDNPRIFKEVKQKIQQHYDSKANSWMAELVYTYLRSPWTIMALLAASLLLLLTLAQTYVAFNPRN